MKERKRVSKIIELIYEHGAITFIIAFLSLIIFYNLCMTSYLVKWEITYYVRDSIIINFALFLLFIIALTGFKKSKYYVKLTNIVEDEDSFNKIRKVFLILIFLTSLFWALCTQYIPGVDEGAIQTFVNDYIQNQYYMFAPGEYMQAYPNNWGLFLFTYAVSIIFGAKNYVIFFIINAFAIAMIYKQLSEIGESYGLGKMAQLMILLVGLLFYPILLYSQMLYGHVLGIAFALTAIKYEEKYLKSHNVKLAIISAMSISIAILFKSNMLIYLIAMLIVGFMHMVRTKEVKRTMLLFCAIFICFEAQSNIPKVILENRTGYEMDNPCSTWAFIAMGLQESDLAPGWWNAYIQTSYSEANRNTAIQSQLAKESIKQSIMHFKDDHEYALEFFTKKIASSWANPTLQCYCIIRTGTNIEVPSWVTHFLSYQGQHKANIYLNIVYFLLLMGALIGAILNFKSSGFCNSLALPIVFAGGFLFNLFWEAKARYTIMYFLPLIPYSILGYSLLLTEILSVAKRGFENKKKNVKYKLNKNYIYPLCVLLVSLILIVTCYANRQHYKYLIQDTEEYYNYIDEASGF